MDAGRAIWAARQLLDRQVVDCNDTAVAKVDDIEFAFSAEPGALPVVADILCGPAALARRFDGRLGSALETLHELVENDAPHPAQISFGVVKEIGSHVALAVPRDELPVTVVEEWLGEHVVAKIPGSGKYTAPEG